MTLLKPESRYPSNGRHLWFGYVFVTTVIVVLVISLASVAFWQEKQRYRERATNAAQNLSHLLDQHISDLFGKIDVVLQSSAFVYSNQPISGQVNADKLNDYLSYQESLLPELDGLRILDKDGFVRFGRGVPVAKPVNLSDREMFIRARNPAENGLIIYGPVFAQISQKWVIAVARRLSAQDGSFAGVVYASLAVEHFDNILSLVAVGPQGAATIRTADLALVHRYPATQNVVGSKEVSSQLREIVQRHPEGGEYIATTTLDGIERINSFRKLKHAPFYVIVGLATDDYLGGWEENVQLVSGLAGLAILITILAAILVRRAHLRSRNEIENRYRAIFQNSLDVINIARLSDGRLIEANQSFFDIHGYESAEAIGRTTPALNIWFDPADRQRFIEMLQRDSKCTNLEARFRRKNGELIWGLVSASVVELDGVPCIISIRRDITDRKMADEAQRMSEKRYRAIFDTSLDIININRLSDGLCIDANQSFFDIQGFERDEVIGRTAAELNIWFDPVERQRFIGMLQRDSRCTNIEARFRRKNGELIWGLVSASVVELDGVPCIISIRRDITDRKRADEALQTSENQFREIFDEAPIGYHQFDTLGRITRINNTELASLGYTEEEMLGHYVWEFIEGSELSKRSTLNKLAGISISTTGFERSFLRKDGTVIPMLVQDKILRDKAGNITGIRSVVMDITERKQAEEKINQLAFYDQLTDLPNRTLLHDRLKQAMASSLRSGRYGALLLIDLDYFKTLNDTLGHDMGDLLLKLVAQRLTECVREEDTVARQGGDEFVVMLASLSENQSEAASLVELISGKINAALNKPFELKDVSYDITPSIGASVFLGHQVDIDTLLKQADLAMYKAKEAGRNTLKFFDPEMARDVMKRASLDNDLREAVQKQQFVLHYQAQVTGSQVTGVEALLRWQHPERGLVFPGEFISVIEETGLILPVGQWVLEMACKQLADWATQPEMSHLTVAVNISARQLNHESFVDQVMVALDRSGAKPERLKLELTESLLVNNVEETIDKMVALKAKGVGFSLDDFGTGYSSLSYLKRLPLDQLKIDQSFVRDILTDPNDAAIAKMIVVLAESLGLAVIAEGVEIEEQRDALLQHGCYAYQGYFFSYPSPIEEFESFVKRA